MDGLVPVRKRVIWRNAFLQFSSNGGDAFAAKCLYVNDSDSAINDDGVDLCPLCDSDGYFITCFAESCNVKCHLNCEYFTRELGLIVNDNGGLEFRCRQHFAVEKFCKCEKEFDDDSRDMLQCKECKNWFHGSCVGESSRGLGLLSTGFDERQTLSSSPNAACTAKLANDYVCHSCRLIVRNGYKVSETVRSRNLENESRCASHQIAIKSIEVLTNIEKIVEPIIDSLLGCDCGADSCRDESGDKNQQALLQRCHTHRDIENQRYSLEQLQKASDIISNVPTSNIEKAEHYLRECYDIFGVLRLLLYWKTIIDKYCAEFASWIQKCDEIVNDINLLLVQSASVCGDNEIQLLDKGNKNKKSKLGEIVTEELLRSITRSCEKIVKAWLDRPGRLRGKDLDAVSLQFSCIYWLHSIFAIVAAMDIVEGNKIDITQADVYTLLVDGCYLFRTLKLKILKYCSTLLPVFQTYLELAVKWHFDCTTTYISTKSPKGVGKNCFNSNMLQNTYWQKFSSVDDNDISGKVTTNTKSLTKVRRYLCKCSRRSGCFSDLPLSDEQAVFCCDFCAHSSAEELLVSLLELRQDFCRRILNDSISNSIVDSNAPNSSVCYNRIINGYSDWEIIETLLKEHLLWKKLI